MRRLLLIFAVLLALPAAAQKAAPPAGLQPVPEPPPLPKDATTDPAFEPQVTIIKRGDDRVEEYRVNGKLYMVKVTPPHGVSYYLIDEKGDGRMTRQDTLEPGLRVPMWVIGTF